MLRIFWEKLWYKNIWLKVDLAQSYGRKCGFSGIFGNACFFYFWSGGKYLGMLYQRGVGSDPLEGKFFILAGIDRRGPKFFLETFLRSPNVPANFENFVKKKFFS